MSAVPVLALTGLVHAYADGTRALDGITVAIQPGEHLAVVGANGAGKSTLLLHANGLLLPTAGAVAVGGVVITRATLAAIRRRVALVFQDGDDQLFCPTVADDVAFGPRQQRLPAAEVERRVDAALAAVGMRDHAQRHPHHLSLGQKKRAAIATALACAPDLLVLDEPTSGLDPRGRRELIDLLAGLGGTLLIATHDLALVERLCRRVLVLSAGRVIADGQPSSVLADGDLLDAAGLR